PELQNQIAAGEVVERPSSVLKELIENSLDAGATRVQTAIQGGGQSMIQVEDNGWGMSPDQLPQAMARHATSKISTFRDLLHIESFGFRGEALPSIGSVSRMRLRSIQTGQSEGAELKVEFGHLSEVKPVPFREGTSIQVQDLFANTPARLKFMKTQATEVKRCQEAVYRFALAHLHASFMLTSNERTVLDFPAGQSLVHRLQNIWPPGITDKLLEVDGRDDEYILSGYVGHPEAAQARGDRILFFVNQRPVQDKMLISALRQAFKGRLLSKEYPQAALFLQIPGQEVDVNVHPAKLEVRFRDEQRVFKLVHHAVAQALNSSLSQVPTGEYASPAKTGSASFEPKYKFHTFEDYLGPQAAESHPENQDSSVSSGSFGSQAQIQTASGGQPGPYVASSLKNGEYTYLGQIQNSYLLLTSRAGELILVDQHAAHERILYHRFSSQGQSRQQRPLALPMQRALHPSEEERLSRVAPAMRSMGFVLDRSQDGAVLIRAVPAHLDPSQAREFLDQILHQQSESQDELWQTMACRQAVKAGDTLSAQEALELIELWLSTPDKEYCPHGRPAMISLRAKDLERMFKRGM
ncbi:MAG: DNA mismatch repair endonuclease MutL, partial [Desulfovermiculus sp.]